MKAPRIYAMKAEIGPPRNPKEHIMGKNQHVVKHGKGWAVRGEGNSRVSSQHGTQEWARRSAVGTAKREKSEVVIHRPDGRIRDKDSYGNDPCPPRDKKH